MLRKVPCLKPDWRRHPPHTHAFGAFTSVEEGHRHRLLGYVYAANGSAYDGHFHYFQGITEAAAGHTHRYYDRTGPAIPLPDGSHYHTVSDVTYYNYTKPVQAQGTGGTPLTGGVVYAEGGRERHRHTFEAVTSRNLGDPPPGW
ncbi:YmaF family protein [Paenibacillus chartarius]|uniref:YmaF family protein n=1 Tax=Paenibacillus chartarius TaxID=747481 RepID=A0ABV6DN70_9BACL